MDPLIPADASTHLSVSNVNTPFVVCSYPYAQVCHHDIAQQKSQYADRMRLSAKSHLTIGMSLS